MKTSPKLSHVSVRLTYLAAAAVGALMLFPAASAQAADVVVGSPLTSTYSSGAVGGVGTAANSVLPEAGANASSPIAGAVVQWSVDGFGGGPFGCGYWLPAVPKRRLPAQERAYLRTPRAPASKPSRRTCRSTLVTSSESPTPTTATDSVLPLSLEQPISAGSLPLKKA